jgi:RNA polymerase sigma factor (sigma-70 family)
MSHVLRHLHRAALAPDGAGLTDAQLLTRFVERRDEAAFEGLVRRHGTMVWGVCRRVLGDHHDAEDAFQAAFLVVARKAAAVVPREQLANWLYGVAYQTAHRARVAAAKRYARERVVASMPEPEAPAPQPQLWEEWQPLLDRELHGLPEKYRVAVVLCDLEGKTRKEAARQLGWKEGTLSGRLARARALLARRLTRQGLALTGAAVAALLSENGASAGVPGAVVASTVRAAALIATGSSAAGLVPARVAALTEGVMKAMLMNKLRVQTGLLLVVTFAGVAAAVLAQPQPGRGRADSAAEATAATLVGKEEGPATKDRIRLKHAWLVRVDAEARTITAILGTKPWVMEAREGTVKDGKLIPGKDLAKMYGLQGRLHNPPELVNVRIAKDASIRIGDKKSKLADLPVNRHVALELAVDDDQFVVTGVLLAADASKHEQGAADALPAERRQCLLRWRITFNTRDGNDYADQLEALGAVLAVPTKKEGEYRVIRDLSKRPVAGGVKDLRKMKHIFLMESDPRALRSLSSALGLKPVPEHVVVLLPRYVEDDLLRKELARAGGQERKIVETSFEFIRTPTGWQVSVVSQRLKE